MRLLRALRGERIELSDFLFGTSTSHRDIAAQQGEVVTVGTDKVGSSAPTPKSFVLSGFAVAVDGAGTVTINGGDAIVGFKDRGQVRFGLLISGGSTIQTTSVAGYATPATYGVFIRGGFTESEIQNRPFWNPFGSPNPTEFVRNIATRETADWQFAIELASPGEEWMQIATIDVAGGPIYTAADKRQFFFEGMADNSYRVVNSEWGATTPPDDNDRSSSRESKGVFGFYRFVRGVQRQIQDIIGGVAPNWWLDPQAGTASGVGPRSLNQLNDEKLARNGAQSMAGDIIPDADVARDLGSAIRQWQDIFTLRLAVSDTVVSNLHPNADITYALGTALRRWTHIFLKAWNTAESLGLDKLVHSGAQSGIIRLNDAAASAKNRAFILAFLNGAPTGTDAKVTICAGDDATQGTGQVQLLGTDNQLAANCMGQNGIAYAAYTFTILVGAVPALGRVTFTAALTGHTGGNITTNDCVIGIIPSDIIRELVLSNPPYISGVNTIAFEVVNPDDTLAKPLINDTVTGTAVILRT